MNSPTSGSSRWRGLAESGCGPRASNRSQRLDADGGCRNSALGARSPARLWRESSSPGTSNSTLYAMSEPSRAAQETSTASWNANSTVTVLNPEVEAVVSAASSAGGCSSGRAAFPEFQSPDSPASTGSCDGESPSPGLLCSLGSHRRSDSPAAPGGLRRWDSAAGESGTTAAGVQPPWSASDCKFDVPPARAPGAASSAPVWLGALSCTSCGAGNSSDLALPLVSPARLPS
mmetsp:Transcript_60174/g.186235  ORF Transcript_60174/g.186235 Transcript_60174/m.186235 type:complete len:232 (-) Transcript_60174:470-1165(-)